MACVPVGLLKLWSCHNVGCSVTSRWNQPWTSGVELSPGGRAVWNFPFTLPGPPYRQKVSAPALLNARGVPLEFRTTPSPCTALSKFLV